VRSCAQLARCGCRALSGPGAQVSGVGSRRVLRSAATAAVTLARGSGTLRTCRTASPVFVCTFGRVVSLATRPL